ncbi:1560_t:CDS:2 [Ambispora gerdemannii]|uniref:1560_t:CDS:1 n=1 Tax=Ambispora gerdemannii TaxID=144530 RepID=A0A9N9BM68_9GLOM|nr:1560_t:CDS:2 [Ambispora gerdemannii]
MDIPSNENNNMFAVHTPYPNPLLQDNNNKFNAIILGNEILIRFRWNNLTPFISPGDTIEVCSKLLATTTYDLNIPVRNCTIIMQPQDTFAQYCITKPHRNWLLINCIGTPE